MVPQASGARPGYLVPRLVVAALGVVIIATDVIQWRRVLDEGATPGPGHIPGLVLGGLLVACGVFGARIAHVYRNAALMLLHVFSVVMFVEVVCGVVLWNQARVRNARVPADMPATPAFRDKPWATAYWREFAESDAQYYMPFTTFRRRPYAGRYVNVGGDRLRTTPGARCEPGAYRVFVYGGSTMWGTGAPDSSTIAAYLQRAISDRVAGPVCVLNFGESAYVVSQGLIGLTLALRAGERPDAVISYDGVNDVFAAYQSGKAGSHQNESAIASGYPRPHWARQMLQASATFTLLRNLAGPGATPSTAPLPVAALADSVTRVYLGAVDEMRKLGEAYHFRTLFFWQPEIGESQKKFTEFEQREVNRQNKRLAELYRESYLRVAAAAANPADDLFDISNALQSEPGEIFFDYAHVVPRGNEVIAAAIMQAWDHDTLRTGAVTRQTPMSATRLADRRNGASTTR